MGGRDRAMHTEEEEMHRMSTTSSTTTPKAHRICSYRTPCAWTVYKPNNPSIVEMYIPNTYCICETGDKCKKVENDTSVNTYIHRCRTPSDKDGDEES
ncbi:hypothetical protein SFRURICE_005926 [Spodoptera frugiperda]|nr:hypothetical protein SFRURICE_005926 [Spodoptera frugiperda]